MKPSSNRTADPVAAFEAALKRQPHYRLRLFVTGNTPRSALAIRNIREICEAWLPGRYDLEVVDIYQHPELIAAGQIVVTPTLVIEEPLPARKIVGDLSDSARVLAGLGLRSGRGAASSGSYLDV